MHAHITPTCTHTPMHTYTYAHTHTHTHSQTTFVMEDSTSCEFLTIFKLLQDREDLEEECKFLESLQNNTGVFLDG